MARMTKEEREQLDALTKKAQAEQESEESAEVWVKKGDHEVKLTGPRARSFLAKLGLDDDEDDEDDEEEEKDEKPADSGGYGYGFGRRKK